MSMNTRNRDIIGGLFIKISEWEGKYFREKKQDDFVHLVYSSSKIALPSLNDIIMNKPALKWEYLHTGDLAAFTNGESFILGIVLGELERQFCFSDPQTSAIRIIDFSETVNDYKYINGFKVISND